MNLLFHSLLFANSIFYFCFSGGHWLISLCLNFCRFWLSFFFLGWLLLLMWVVFPVFSLDPSCLVSLKRKERKINLGVLRFFFPSFKRKKKKTQLDSTEWCCVEVLSFLGSHVMKNLDFTSFFSREPHGGVLASVWLRRKLRERKLKVGTYLPVAFVLWKPETLDADLFAFFFFFPCNYCNVCVKLFFFF